jgi:hypothetical protein
MRLTEIFPIKIGIDKIFAYISKNWLKLDIPTYVKEEPKTPPPTV